MVGPVWAAAVLGTNLCDVILLSGQYRRWRNLAATSPSTHRVALSIILTIDKGIARLHVPLALAISLADAWRNLDGLSVRVLLTGTDLLLVCESIITNWRCFGCFLKNCPSTERLMVSSTFANKT